MIIGVVGKANVGKSTFFKACTLAEVEIANYPFATIKPNHGVGYVRVLDAGPDFGVTSNPREGFILGKYRFVPVEMIDVAGLVPGAYEGKGMGNQFLDDLRQADILIHVIDASGSTNELGEPVQPGSYNPANDIRFLEVELDMWYLNILKKPWEKFAKQVQQEHADVRKAIAKQFSGLGVKEEIVDEALKKLGFDTTKVASWSDDQIKDLAVELRKRTKPMIIAANKVDTPTGRKNFKVLKSEFPGYTIIPCSAESELALKEAAKHGLINYIPGEENFEVKTGAAMSEEQKKALEFIKANVLKAFGSTGVQKVLDTAVFDILKYIAVFPGGVGKLQDQDGNYIPDCFLMPPGTTPLAFAYRLHTDFGKNFIKAIDVRTKMPIAKDSPLKHRDVVEIMTSK